MTPDDLRAKRHEPAKRMWTDDQWENIEHLAREAHNSGDEYCAETVRGYADLAPIIAGMGNVGP